MCGETERNAVHFKLAYSVDTVPYMDNPMLCYRLKTSHTRSLSQLSTSAAADVCTYVRIPCRLHSSRTGCLARTQCLAAAQGDVCLRGRKRRRSSSRWSERAKRAAAVRRLSARRHSDMRDNSKAVVVEEWKSDAGWSCCK